MNIEFKDDRGRRIRADQFGQHVKKAVDSHLQHFLDEQAATMANELGLDAVRCMEHGSTAKNWRLVPKEPGSSHHLLAYDECCQSLVEAICSAASQ